MRDWIKASDELPPQAGPDGAKASELVRVLLNTGEEAEDWLINGRWVLYCANNPDMPHVVAWRPL